MNSDITSSTTSNSRRFTLSTVVNGVVRAVLDLPRLLRIVLSAVFAAALVLLLHPLMDVWYYDTLYDFMLRNTTEYIARSGSTYLLATVGLLHYLAGWRLIVGTRGDKMRPRWPVFAYIVLSVLVIIANIGLILYGLSLLE